MGGDSGENGGNNGGDNGGDNGPNPPSDHPQKDLYPDFDEIMSNKFGDYLWEGLEVTTEDDYILTTFHIWKAGAVNDDKGPVLFQHGSGGNAFGWLNGPRGELPNCFKLADMGHHIYLGNNRGAKYSKGHISLDYKDDAVEYWRFSQTELTRDVYAQVGAMYTNAGQKKGYYFGSSLGGAQMTLALINDESRLVDKLNRAIILAPCTVLGANTEPLLNDYNLEKNGALVDLGVHSLPTADWNASVIAIQNDDRISDNDANRYAEKWRNTDTDTVDNWSPQR